MGLLRIKIQNFHFRAVESIDGYWFFFCDLVDRLPSIKIFLDNLPFTLDHQDFVINVKYDSSLSQSC